MEKQPKIFINYRRHGDASGYAMQLYEDLVKEFGAEQVFKDLRNIGPGEEFVEAFSQQVASCRVFLAVIGKNWLSISAQRRAENKKDFVHLELRSALERRSQNKQAILIIPVLLDGAEMPSEADLPDELKGLAALNEYRLLEEYWTEGMQRLIKHLREVLGEAAPRVPEVSREELVATPKPREDGLQKSGSKSPNFVGGVVGGGLGGFLMGAIVGAIYSSQYSNIPKWRFIIAALDGLVAGTISGWFISYGIVNAAKLRKGSGYAKVVGGIIGGAVGGIPTIILGGMIFFWSAQGDEIDPVLNAIGGGDLINPFLVALAVSLSSFCIALGLLAPPRQRIPITIFVVGCVSVGVLMIVIGLMAANLQSLKRQLAIESPVAPQVLIFGLLFGVMAGFQAGLSLFVYDRFTRAGES